MYKQIDTHTHTKNMSINIIDVRMGRDSNDNQRQCDHRRWPEANVGQEYRKGPDRLVQQMSILPATSTLKKASYGIPTWAPPHLPGLTLNQYTTWLAAQKTRTCPSLLGG